MASSDSNSAAGAPTAPTTRQASSSRTIKGETA
jgi:hypothetical protein